MLLAGALESIDLGEYFAYHGRENEIVPKYVIRIKIHPSVKVIKERAFEKRVQLTTVTPNDGLEEIGERA